MPDPTNRERLRAQAASVGARAKDARHTHVSVAVPFRAADRNRRVAASALAWGDRLPALFWLIPFALVVGRALGFADADSAEEAIEAGGLPAGATKRSRRYGTGGRISTLMAARHRCVGRHLGRVQRLQSGDPHPHVGLGGVSRAHFQRREDVVAFTGMAMAVMLTIAATSWLHEVMQFGAVVAAALTITGLAGLWLLVSLRLPHGSAHWKALLPGAFLFGVVFGILHLATLLVLIPKLERSTSVYGAIGAVTTTLFWFYLVGRLVVTARILNVATDEELQEAARTSAAQSTLSLGGRD